MAIETLRPNAVGDSTQFTIGGTTPAPTNWESVDEAVADEDVTLVESDSSFKRDLYNIQNSALPGGTTINFVTLYSRVKQVSVTRDSGYIGIKSGATEDWGGHLPTITGVWVTRSRIFNTDPNTGAPWTVAALNALQIGVKIWAGDDGMKCTQTYVDVDYTVAGWTGKISGVTNPAKIMGVDVANIAKVKGVA